VTPYELDTDALARELSSRLGWEIRLSALTRPRASGVAFRGESASDDHRCFVKVTPRGGCERSAPVYRACQDLPFVPRLMLPDVFTFSGCDVLCLEFLEGKAVDALENLTEEAFESLLCGYRRFSAAVASIAGQLPAHASALVDRLGELLSPVRKRGWLVRRAFSTVLSIDLESCRTESRRMDVIHNDFHLGNLGFEGDRLSAIYDLEHVDSGIACEDIVYLLCCRYVNRGLSAVGRLRLRSLLLRAVELMPWPRSDWQLAFRLCRLKRAAAVLMSQSGRISLRTALAVRRQDRRVMELEEVVA